MKQFTLFFTIITISTSLLLSSACGSKEGENSTSTNQDSAQVNETSLLLEFTSKSGNVINSEQAPFTIGADEVFEELSDILVIDIRDTTDYFTGHIDGALQVAPNELPDYLEQKANVAAYKKVVLACYSGQSSAYYATLLRLVGYSNVYTLRYGMAGWSKKTQPNRILDNLSNKYAGMLETTANPNDQKYSFPKVKTGETTGYNILRARVKTLFEEGFGKAHIKMDSVVQKLDQYFVVNYWPIEDYSKGHLPGSFQFTPKKSLAKDQLLTYLPTDKQILVYCTSGQTSASTVAYLRILGYNAISISFGTNGFSHGFTQANQIKSFNPAENIADYPMVEGKTPSLKMETTAISTNTQTAEKESAIPVVKKKKKAGGGGGC